MKLPFLQKGTSQSNKFLSLNINSKEVRGLTIYYDNGKYKIIGTGREQLENGSVRNGVIIDKDDVVRAVKNVVIQATEELEEKVNNVILGVNGDLCLGLMTTIRFKRTANLPIEKSEVDNLYDKITEAANIQAQNEYLEISGNPDIALQNITSSNVYLRIDGQRVEDLQGQSGTTVEAAVFNAFAPEYHTKSLQEVIRKAGLNIMAIGSEMYAFVQWIKQHSKGQEDFVLLTLDNESTNVAVVFGGGIASTKSLNIGFSHFVEGVAEKMGITSVEAEKLVKGYIAGKMMESESAVIQKAIVEIADIWLSGLELLFGEFSNVKTFAPKIFITGYGAEIKDVLSILKSEPWTKTIPFKSFPDISKVNFSDFEKISDATGKVGGAEWLGNVSMSIIYEEIFGI